MDNEVKDREIQLLSEEVQEIINYKPHWIIQRGSYVFLFMLVIGIAFTFFIEYPDTIKTSARIVAVNAPKMHQSKINGKIERILVKTGQQVSKNEPLAYLQSIARHEEIITLKKWIEEVEPQVKLVNLNTALQKPLPLLTELGEIQTSYQNFQNILKETQQLAINGYYDNKANGLQKDIEFLDQLQQGLEKQKYLLERQYALQKEEFNVNEKLAAEKVIAPLEFNREKSKLLDKEQAFEQINSQLINNRISKHNKNKELQDLRKFEFDQNQKFVSAFFTLKSQVAEWVEKHMVLAAETGTVEFTSFLQPNQLLSIGQNLFFIQSEEANYYAELKAGQSGFGKIINGQKVLIKLQGYPDSEFGYLPGTISFISNLPSARDSFLIKTELTNGLETTYHKSIYFRNNLSGTAEIITRDEKLSDRLLGQLKEIFRR